MLDNGPRLGGVSLPAVLDDGVELIPQEHGGALRPGGKPGNSGGNGRDRIVLPRELIPADAVEIARKALPSIVRAAIKMARDKNLPPHERVRAASFVHAVAAPRPGESDRRKPPANVRVTALDAKAHTRATGGSVAADPVDLTQDVITRSDTAPAVEAVPTPSATHDERAPAPTCAPAAEPKAAAGPPDPR